MTSERAGSEGRTVAKRCPVLGSSSLEHFALLNFILVLSPAMSVPPIMLPTTSHFPRNYSLEADDIVIRTLMEAVREGLSPKGRFTNAVYTMVSEKLLGAGYKFSAVSVGKRFHKVNHIGFICLYHLM